MSDPTDELLVTLFCEEMWKKGPITYLGQPNSPPSILKSNACGSASEQHPVEGGEVAGRVKSRRVTGREEQSEQEESVVVAEEQRCGPKLQTLTRRLQFK